ncbi:MAG: hypothetical protein VB050_06350 [Geobacteraceae bacterium]|nr:hypothetical protein [Geobacteraceae bacterium]
MKYLDSIHRENPGRHRSSFQIGNEDFFVLARKPHRLTQPGRKKTVSGWNLDRFLKLLLSILLIGCSATTSPVQTNGGLTYGRYAFTPPAGHWFFPRKYQSGDNTSQAFVVTFWESRESISRKILKENETISNFAIYSNNFKNYQDYYDRASGSGIKYKALPDEAKALKNLQGWNCMQTDYSYYGIECVSLRKELITFGIYGNEKSTVLSKISTLQKLIESFAVR